MNNRYFIYASIIMSSIFAAVVYLMYGMEGVKNVSSSAVMVISGLIAFDYMLSAVMQEEKRISSIAISSAAAFVFFVVMLFIW